MTVASQKKWIFFVGVPIEIIRKLPLRKSMWIETHSYYASHIGLHKRTHSRPIRDKQLV